MPEIPPYANPRWPQAKMTILRSTEIIEEGVAKIKKNRSSSNYLILLHC